VALRSLFRERIRLVASAALTAGLAGTMAAGTAAPVDAAPPSPGVGAFLGTLSYASVGIPMNGTPNLVAAVNPQLSAAGEVVVTVPFPNNAVYVGPVTISGTVTEPLYGATLFGESGTISALTVTGINGLGGSIHCDSTIGTAPLTGSLVRTDAVVTITATATTTSGCTVNGQTTGNLTLNMVAAWVPIPGTPGNITFAQLAGALQFG